MDCLEGMKAIDDKSIDLILCDLPYGMTDCQWDSLIPFPPLWEQYRRIIKDNGAIVLTASQPFTTKLISSNPKWFRYCWYWNKNMATGFPFAKHQPLRCIEEAVVFYKRKPTYNPQGLIRPSGQGRLEVKSLREDSVYRQGLDKPYYRQYRNYPRQILSFATERGLHPTQKPVSLFEYFVRTYTNEGNLVLDNCIGSGTTAIACLQNKRNFIGFEKDKKYFDIAVKRIADFTPNQPIEH